LIEAFNGIKKHEYGKFSVLGTMIMGMSLGLLRLPKKII
jgi:hypothetical protein